MILEETTRLNNGVMIPRLGFGTWLIDDSIAEKTVRAALDAGYRHIDTAQAYGNEEGVGKGLRASGLRRSEVFLTTKVAAEIKDYSKARKSIDESLRRLNMEHADLILIHCPQPWTEYRSAKRYLEENLEVWRALEEAYKEGKTRSIGISNFIEIDILNILEGCSIRPMVNQIEIHIGETPTALIEYCRKEDIAVEAYSPIAHGRALRSPEIVAMAESYGVTPAQLCIRYTLQLGTIALPKSADPNHIADNTKLDFHISDRDMKVLETLEF